MQEGAIWRSVCFCLAFGLTYAGSNISSRVISSLARAWLFTHCVANSLQCTMAVSNITTTFAGHGNQGLQVGYSSGSIHIAAAGKYPSVPAPTCAALTTLCLCRASRDPTTGLVLHPVPTRSRLYRPRDAARSDPRAVLCASIKSSAGGSWWSGVSSAEGTSGQLTANAHIGSRSWPSSTATAPLSARRRRGCSGRTLATRRDWSRASKR
jgi:hypothetical protein